MTDLSLKGFNLALLFLAEDWNHEVFSESGSVGAFRQTIGTSSEFLMFRESTVLDEAHRFGGGILPGFYQVGLEARVIERD